MVFMVTVFTYLYRARTQTSVIHRIASDMLRDRDIEQRPIVLNALYQARRSNGVNYALYPD